MKRQVILSLMCVLLLSGLGLGGCNTTERIPKPDEYKAPYRQPVRWAVIPLVDKAPELTEEQRADRLGVTYAIMLNQQLQQIEGIDVAPIADVIRAMRKNDLPRIDNAAQATLMMKELDVQGILCGDLTSWYAYSPMRVGVNMKLYTAESELASTVDSRSLAGAASSNQLPQQFKKKAETTLVANINAANGKVLNRLKSYARGRTELESPEGWRTFLISMPLYAEFTAHEVIRQIFAKEWQRLYADN